MANFTFKDRETGEILTTVETTIEQLEQEHGNDLTQLYAEYDATLHSVEYHS
jgi:hypothetical protein